MKTQGRKIDKHEGRKQLWDYWQRPNGEWWGQTPAGICNLGAHEITEHEDGSISASPSILVGPDNAWHGYLERGVWREVA